MRRLGIDSLQKKLDAFLLIPLAVVLFGTGIGVCLCEENHGEPMGGIFDSEARACRPQH